MWGVRKVLLEILGAAALGLEIWQDQIMTSVSATCQTSILQVCVFLDTWSDNMILADLHTASRRPAKLAPRRHAGALRTSP